MRFLLMQASLLITLLCAGNAYAANTHVHSAEANKGSYAATLMSLGIEQPWSRALPPTAYTGAVFVNIHNQGPAERLLRAYSDISDKVELHNHIHQDGLMKMVEVSFIEVAENTLLELKPGSFHIMLIGLRQPLIEGQHFPVTLEFEHSGRVELQVEVRSINAGTAAEHMQH